MLRSLSVAIIPLLLFHLCLKECVAYKGFAGEGMKIESEKSARWKVMTESAISVFENSLLLLATGSPLADIKVAYHQLTRCVSRAYEEHISSCIQSPAHSVVAALFVLTDYHTWLWPPDIDVADNVQSDVLARRLKPAVREDQCGHADKPS